MSLPYFDALELSDLVPVKAAVDALERAFAARLPSPPMRVHHRLPDGDELLLMPAWDAERVGVKLVTIEPRNAERGLPLIHGVYVAFDADRRPVAVFDGGALTVLRTAAVSGLATRYLARRGASSLLVMGAGAQARAHVAAMAAVRPVRDVRVVSRGRERAAALVAYAESLGLSAQLGTPDDVREADLVCTCTTSATPVLAGDRLAPGVHVNAIGAYRPDLRELDAAAVVRSRVVVETREVALAEAGDLLLAASEGAWDPSDVAGDLAELVQRKCGRASPTDITLFKSVGMASEDLAVAGAALVAAASRDGRDKGPPRV